MYRQYFSAKLIFRAKNYGGITNLDIFKELDTILAGNILRDRAINLALSKPWSPTSNDSQFNLSAECINAVVNGDENGINCILCHYFFPAESMKPCGKGYICHMCLLKNMHRANVCCICKKITLAGAPFDRLMIPTINILSSGNIANNLMYNTFKDDLYPFHSCLVHHHKFYIPRRIIPSLKDFLLKHEKHNATYIKHYQEVIQLLEKCYENYGKPICYGCMEHYSKTLLTQNYEFELAWLVLNWNSEMDKDFRDFVNGEHLSLVNDYKMRVKEAEMELRTLDRENLLKLKYHPEILSEFTERDWASLRSTKGFQTTTANIKRMALSAVKYSIKQFANIILEDLGLVGNENCVCEVDVNANGVDGLLIIPTDAKVSVSEEQISKLFEQIVLKREFRNYLSDNNFLTSSGITYTPYIDSYNIDLDDSDPENILIIINLTLGYRKEKPTNSI